MKAMIFRRGEEEWKRRGDKITFRKILFFISLSPLLLFSSSFPTAAQSGGAFSIEKSVIASGGTSAGGAFTVQGVAGQPSAGNLQNPPFTLFGGFITPLLAPTTANVFVAGRVTTASGSGIRNVSVMLTDANGGVRTTVTGTFGIYRFADLPAGQTYIISVSARKFSFANPVQVVNVSENLEELNFVGSEL